MERWVVGNWKMNGSQTLVRDFVPALVKGLPAGWREAGTRVAICPPLPLLGALRAATDGTAVQVGAQRVHPLPSGAFTGEVSPAMLAEFGATLCLVGHSEQRQYFSVTNSYTAQQVHALLAAEIAPVLCVGETLAEREAGRQEAVIQTQLLEALQASDAATPGRRRGDPIQLQHPELSGAQAAQLIVAYEPVWAIGTGQTATPEQAGEMHRFIRGLLNERFGAETAAGIPLLYGGSVNPGNAGELMAQPEINGTLVGGASLKPETFLPIIEQSLS